MALDGIFLKLLTTELSSAADSRIEKIYQPQKDVLVFLLRRAGFHKKLLLCARPDAARVQFTELEFDNPEVPPMLCMLFRKTLSGGRIISIETDGFERVVTISVETVNEMGDRVICRVICELIGSKSNIILVNGDGRIIDAVRRSDIENSSRLIQPGAKYQPPEKLIKTDITKTQATSLAQAILKKGEDIAKSALDTVSGLSPLIARETAARANDENTLVSTLTMLKSEIANGGTPVMLKKGDAPFDFTYIKLLQYGDSVKCSAFPSYCELLDAFYREKEIKAVKADKAADLLKILTVLTSRAEKKIKARHDDLKKCENREQYRIYGELLKANLHLCEKGASAVRVQNFYDPELKEITIPLDKALSPQQNAAKYFKDYKKYSGAAGMLEGLIADGEAELKYIESVFDSLTRAEKASELDEIRQELYDSGLYRKNCAQKHKKTVSEPLKFVTSGGFTVLVGKNNIQNDYITTRIAEKGDYWFHVKDFPGSHTLLVCGGKTPSNADLEEAAELAAGHSKAANAQTAAVDMVEARYVKKPSGARPGMVIFKNQTTVFVTPRKTVL